MREDKCEASDGNYEIQNHFFTRYLKENDKEEISATSKRASKREVSNKGVLSGERERETERQGETEIGYETDSETTVGKWYSQHDRKRM